MDNACFLLIKNIERSAGTGTITGAFPLSHQFGRLESKSVYEAAGGVDFPKEFVIIKVLDKGADSPEILELIGSDRKFLPMTLDKQYCDALSEDAYIEVTFTKCLEHVEE